MGVAWHLKLKEGSRMTGVLRRDYPEGRSGNEAASEPVFTGMAGHGGSGRTGLESTIRRQLCAFLVTLGETKKIPGRGVQEMKLRSRPS